MRKVLFIGAHADDIELGCGATIHKHAKDWEICCVTLARSSYAPKGEGPYPDIWTRQKAALESLGVTNCLFYDFPTNYFEQQRNGIWQTLRALDRGFRPDWVFTHEPDTHQDHVTTHQETCRNFFGSSMFLYHIPRSSQRFDPNYCEVISQADLDAKKYALSRYEMYQDKHYFNPANIEAALRVNGLYVGQTYAEGFKVVRLVEA